MRCNGDSLVPPDEYMEEIAPEGEYEQLGFDKILEAYRRCGYPEAAIRQQNEMIAGMIRNNGKFSGKRFSDDPC